MTEYSNENTFALFQNDKGDNPNRPDRTGRLNVDGVEYYIDGWLKKDKNGNSYLQGKVKRKEKQVPPDHMRTQRAPSKPRPVEATPTDDDDIPF